MISGTPSRLVSLLLAVAVVDIAGCARDEGTQPEAADALVEVTLPAADTMQPEVAEAVSASWQQLQQALSASDATVESRAEAYADFGSVTFGNGLVIPAEAALVNATRLAPDDARWNYFLALVRQFTGSLDESAAGFERVLQLQPGNLPALLRLGDVRLEQARFDQAKMAYGKALELDPESAAAHYGLGRLASADGDDQRAVEHFETALEIQPYADRLNYLLGLAWRNLGDQEKAQAYLRSYGTNEPGFDDPLFDQISGGEARIGGLWAGMTEGTQAYVDGDYELAVEKFVEATADHPDDPRSWQSLGMALNKLGDRDGAEEAYAAALKLAEDSASIRYNLAALLMADGRIPEAQQHLETAIEIDPQMISAHTLLAELHADNGRIDEALMHFDHALALDPQSGTLVVSKAQVLVAAGREQQALQELAAAVEVSPRDAEVRLAQGMMLNNAGRPDAALVEIEEAIALSGDDAERARGHYSAGRVELQRGNLGPAVNWFNSALELNPDHLAARLELARILVRARRYEQAVSMYRGLLERAPTHSRARVEAAGAAILLGDVLLARNIMEAGAKHESATPGLLSSLARLLVLTRDPEVRDPELALSYARAAFEKSDALPQGETVALCLAGVGRFDEAVELQQRLVSAAEGQANQRTIARLEDNLISYRSGGLGRLPLDAS